MRRTLILSILLVLLTMGIARAEVTFVAPLTSNLTPSIGVSAALGVQVAQNDDFIFAGANGDSVNNDLEGAVIVYDRNTLVETQRLTASNTTAGLGFGRYLTADNDTLVVTGPGSSNRAVYIFTESGGVWTEQQIIPPPPPGLTNFGISLALDGDRLAIGQWVGSGGLGRENVFIYERSGGVFTLQQQLVPADNQPLDLFGQSVALSGDLLIAGAARGDAGATDTGAVYISTRSGGTWEPLQQIPYPGVVRGGGADIRVAYDGTTLIASDEFANVVFVYELVGGAWQIAQTIDHPLPTANANALFGNALAVQGNRMVVTAARDDPRVSGSGTGYVYALDSGGTWQFVDQIINPQPSSGAQFGSDVALNNGRVVIGEPFTLSPGSPGVGSAYVFDLTYFDGAITLDPDTVVVTDPDLNRDPTTVEVMAVALQNITAGDPVQTITLTETSADSGIFAAPVTIAFLDGDTLRATYDDVVNTTPGPVLRSVEVTIPREDIPLVDADDDDDNDGGDDPAPGFVAPAPTIAPPVDFLSGVEELPATGETPWWRWW